MTDERDEVLWAPVADWPRYEVSRRGEVRVAATGELAPGSLDTKGYPQVSLYTAGRRTTRKIHRCVMEAFVGSRLPGMSCNHRNGNKLDNRLENLEWVTVRENNHHAMRTGLSRAVCGEEHGSARLNEETVKVLFVLARSGVSQRLLARVHRVSHTLVWQIANGRIWSHVTREL